MVCSKAGSISDKTQIYDFIKVAAEILVVLQHITVMYSGSAAVPLLTSSRALSALYAVLAAGTMPIFMCICGCVYSHCLSIGKYRNRLKFIGNKFKRLMVPYFFFSAFMVAPVTIKLGIASCSYPEFLLYGTLLGGLTRHLWFCLSLFSIFILCAVFRSEKASPFWMLPLIVLVSYAGTQFRSPYLQLHQTAYYTLYFYAGMLIDRHWAGFAQLIRSHRLIFASISLIAWPVCALLLPQFKFAPALGAILFAFVTGLSIKASNLEAYSFYAVLKRDSFGIYLLHPMLLYLSFYALRESTANPYLVSALSFILVYAVSMLITELMRKLHLGVLIGEKSRKNAA